MATTNSFADVMLEWQKILKACTDNGAALSAAEPQRVMLEQMFRDAQELRALQDSHQAAKQAIRQQLGRLVKDGREAVRRLKGAVKANLGTDNERLVQFNIAPNRPRGPRKAKQLPPPKPPAEDTAQIKEEGAPRNPTAP
jgi:hypothetical protein